MVFPLLLESVQEHAMNNGATEDTGDTGMTSAELSGYHHIDGTSNLTLTLTLTEPLH